MHKQVIRTIFVLVFAVSLSACGNKGELYLEPDAQLVKDLENSGVGLVESIDEITDDDVIDDQKKPVKKQ